MKTDELTSIGLTDEQATQVLAINGKDIEKHKSRITSLEEERDNYKNQLDTANATLKKFDGIDPTKFQEEIQTYKSQAEEAERNYNLKITQRDQRDWLNKKLDAYGVSSPLARKQIVSECMDEDSGLTWKDGSFFGFDDYMKSEKEKDSTLYLTAEEKAEKEKATKLKEKSPYFTGPAGNKNDPDEKVAPPKFF